MFVLSFDTPSPQDWTYWTSICYVHLDKCSLTRVCVVLHSFVTLCQHSSGQWSGDGFRKTQEGLNLRALKCSSVNEVYIFQYMCKIFWRLSFKFHTKYLTVTLKNICHCDIRIGFTVSCFEYKQWQCKTYFIWILLTIRYAACFPCCEINSTFFVWFISLYLILISSSLIFLYGEFCWLLTHANRYCVVL